MALPFSPRAPLYGTSTYRPNRTEMDALRFNTAIAKLNELNNAVTKLVATPQAVAEPMVLMAAPGAGSCR